MPNTEALQLLGSVVHTANVLLEWLMTYAIHSTILIGGLLLLTSTTAGRKLASGHGSWIWRFALVGAVITSTLQSVRSAAPLAGTVRLDGETPTRTLVRVEARRVDNVNVAGPARRTTRMTQDPNGARPEHRATRTAHNPNGVRREMHGSVVNSSIEITPAWPLIVFVAWFAIASAMVCWFVLARGRFLKTIGLRQSANNTLAGNALRYLQREGRISRPITLTVSDSLTSPVALSSDEICLPTRALAELDPVRMESILAHELAHLERRDPAWLTIARLIETIFFFQPLNILARRRMQEAAEFASDAWASSRVTRPLDLAHCLARVAEWTIAAPRFPVPAMAERRGAVLVRRVERLTTGRVIPENAPGRGVRLAAVVALVGLIMLAPRAAVGAERSAERFFDRQLRNDASVVIVRTLNEGRVPGPYQRDVQGTFMIRVQP